MFETLYTVAKDVLQFGWDHPGLLVVTGVACAVVGVITWHKSKGN